MKYNDFRVESRQFESRQFGLVPSHIILVDKLNGVACNEKICLS